MPRSDSQTAERCSNRLLYSIAGNEGWKLESIDVTSAFLQGAEVNHDIFVTPPKKANMEGYLWKMKKAAYGLYDASPLLWWIKVMEEMTKLEGKTLVGDKSLVYFLYKGKLIDLITLYMHDFQ